MSSAWGGIQWRLVLLLTAIAALNYCDRNAISAVYPLVRQDLRASDVELAAIGSVFLWSYAAGSLAAGFLADRYPRHRIVVLSLACWSAITIWTGTVRSLDELLVTRACLGLAECAYLPAAVALLADRHEPGRRGLAIAIHTAGLSLGTVAGATAAGYLGERYGWRLAFLLLGAGGLLLTAIAAVALPGSDAPAGGREKAGSGAGVLPSLPSYWLLLVQSMLVSIGVWMFSNWLPLYFQETFDMSLAAGGFFGTVLVQLPGAPGVVVGGAFSDWLARRNRAARMLLQSVCYAVAAPVLLVFAGRPVLFAAGAALLCFSILRSIALSNENPLLCDLLPSQQRSAAIGLMNTANCLAGGAGVLVAGLFKKSYGLGVSFAGVSLVLLLTAAITAIGYRFILSRDLQRDAAAGS